MKKKSNKRAVDIVVISDVHLGTFGCHAKELLVYLKSIKPKILILNGDIIDIWQFSKRYWPKSHMKVVKQIIGMAAKGVNTFYITGNHDELLRKFNGFEIGTLKIVNQLVIDIDGKKAWFFHGDIFDVIMKHSKWLARAGSIGYSALLMLNNFVNLVNKLFGQQKSSISKIIKDNVKTAVKYINNFEETAAQLASKKEYQYIVCGHIHHAEIRTINTGNSSVTYLNSGDWVENLTSLEYNKGKWSIYSFIQALGIDNVVEEKEEYELSLADYKPKQLFSFILKDIENDVKVD